VIFKLACFFKRKTQDFTRYFQSLDTNSCELIVIDRAGGTFSLSADHGRSPTGKRKSFVHG
jgi:hypothetical protein